ncbi:hypothetical protein N665_0171s0112 [Sinapis alba]|nr:hypothetical protein N665_0171s0112 [Sinapis alba]
MKLTIGISTCLLLLCLVLLLKSSTIFNHHKSVFTVTRPNDYEEPRDKLLGGLFNADPDEDSCLSRYHSSLYRKTSLYKPCQYLISKLRRYEMLHKRCGPGTEAYKRATENLVHNDYNHVSNSSDECRYVLWMSPLSGLGLGNRMISMVSVFLYALLTERIMLVDQRSDTSDLFCEPLTGTSWLLPLDSPLMDQLDSFNKEHSRCYGTMLKNHGINSTSIPSQLYLYLFHDYGDLDKMFFCEDNQMIIGKVRWLGADEILGIQVRVLEEGTSPIKHVMDQIVACTQREKLLPEVDTHQGSQVTTTEKPSKLKTNTGNIVPFVRHCEDRILGIKLVQDTS